MSVMINLLLSNGQVAPPLHAYFLIHLRQESKEPNCDVFHQD